jgi:hypothetical protein
MDISNLSPFLKTIVALSDSIPGGEADKFLAELDAWIPGQTPQDQAQLALTLWRFHFLLGKLLEPLKEGLRTEAVQSTGGEPGPVDFTAPNGSCRVVVLEERAYCTKGFDPAWAKEALDANFPNYFSEEVRVKYVPVDDFLDKAFQAEPMVMSTLHHLVDIKTDTHRVTFSPTDKP